MNSDIFIIRRTSTGTDYCVSGRLVSVSEGSALPRDVFIYELERYAAYIAWRVRNKARFGAMPLVAFDYLLVV